MLSDEGGEWIQVKNVKLDKRLKKEEESKRWEILARDYPHIITPVRAGKIQLSIKVVGLVEKFSTEEWIDLQRNGWVYNKTIKSGKDVTVEQKDYLLLDIGNKWGDKALFFQKEKNDVNTFELNKIRGCQVVNKNDHIECHLHVECQL